MKKLLVTFIVATFTFMLVACNTLRDENPSNLEREEVSITQSILTGADLAESGTSYDTSGLTRTEVTQTFLTNPTRVAIYSYDALDILDYVGLDDTSIEMLGVVKNNLPSFLSDYSDEAYYSVGTLFLPDYDALDLFQPELIIVGARSTGAYDDLTSHYPNANILDVTMVYGEYEEGLSRNANNLKAIFPSVAEDIESALDDLTTDMATIREVTKSHEALFILVNGQSLSFYGTNGRFAVLYDEFGFAPADDSADTGGSHGDLVGYEYVSAVDPDVLFLLDRAAAIGNESSLDEVINNSLIQGTTAGNNNHIFTLDGEAWYLASGGFTATETMISDIQVFVDATSE